MPKVVFPCDLDNWWRVKDELHRLKEDCAQQENFNIKDIAHRHQRILDINQGILDDIHVQLGDTTYSGLVKYFWKYATEDETYQFLRITFPSIISFALEIEAHLPSDELVIFEQQNDGRKELSRRMCCCVVACSFLCLFPEENRGKGTKLPCINFTDYFKHLQHVPSQRAKLKCILNFFDRVTAEKNRLTGALVFTRQVIKREELPTLDTWLNCTSELCEVSVHHDGLIEEAGCNTVEIDFANRFIGGGVLSRGRVQEEIRFTVCPELMVAMLFMESMEDNEAIVIEGYEQFSAVHGYAADLHFAGDHTDSSEVDENGNKKNMLCAIDAVSYKNLCDPTAQFLDHCVLRDLNKAFTGFCTPFHLPAGLRVRCLSQESYVTAIEDLDGDLGEDDLQHNPQIDRFVEHLLHEAIGLAMSDASKSNSVREEHLGAPSGGNDQYSHLNRQSSMDHLDVNFRDWYANYRRRSSNLSDLSSRRSSYDLASRRSSACSRGGYSSEYSSELEEYDNCNNQYEQKYKYHTITEEVGSSLIHEFAASLAASLLREGAEKAAGVTPPPQEFHGLPPNFEIHRPLPVRISTTSLSTLDSVENEEAIAKEDYIRQYVDKLFETIWPFNSCDVESDDHNLQSRSELLLRILEDDNFSPSSNRICENNQDDTVELIQDCPTMRRNAERGDESFLIEVAEQMVAIAFEDALVEYRYLMCESGQNNLPYVYSVSESSQSDHSIDIKDQSHSNLVETSQSKHTLELNIDQASKMADQLMSSIFSKSIDSSSTSPVLKASRLSRQQAFPRQHSCDTNLLTIDSPSNKSHSTSSDSSDIASKKHDMFNGEAEKIVSGGLTASFSGEDKHSSSEILSSSFNMSSDSSQSDSSLGRLFLTPAACDVRHLSSQNKVLRSPTKKDESHVRSHLTTFDFPRKSSMPNRSPTKLEEARNKYFSKSVDTKSSELGPVEFKRPSSISPKKLQDRRPIPSLVNQKSTESEKNRQFDTKQRLNFSSESSVSSGAYASAKPHCAAKVSVPHHHKPTPKERLKLKHNQHFSAGNKKNYDQFANCLSRDLLTNAFLQVQEHNEPIAYPRRSSEPIQISNGAALQRYEHSFHLKDGKRSQKSKTDEDISQFEDEWLQQCNSFHSRSSSGFRDPVLSRFAEELMKANVSIPPLQLAVTTSDTVSVSSSSHSVCSTFSSFRDPLLASFEDELLNTNDRKLARTQMSWSKMKGSKCSPRESGNSNSSSSHESRKYLAVSMSLDSDGSALSGRSSSSNNQFVKSVSDFAEVLSRRIVCEALTVVKKRTVTSPTGTCNYALDIYSDMLAKSVLQSAMAVQELKSPDWTDQSKVVKWSDEMKCLHYNEEDTLNSSDIDTSRDRDEKMADIENSSEEYEDALDIPFKRLEEFADVLASKVLINSVAISRREQLCHLRRQYGRPIATGNWGCGAFGGDPHLKYLIQWMAASYAGCPCLLYYTFRHEKMGKLQEVVDTIQGRQWDVAKLMQVVRQYCIIAQSEINLNGYVSRDLFDVILQGEIFPGV